MFKKHLRITLIVGIGLLVVITAVAGLKRRAATMQQTISPEERASLEQKEKRLQLTFKDTARLAAARGQKQVYVPARRSLYAVAQSQEELNRILSENTVVIAEPIAVIGYVQSDGHSEVINSWYKFRILDLFAVAPPHPSYVVRNVPNEFQPISGAEFVMGRPEGTVTIDGIEITQNDEGVPQFRKGHRYLMIVSLNQTTRVAELDYAPQGVLPIRQDGSVDERFRQSNLYQVIQQYHNSSLTQLRNHLQKPLVLP